jgi:putative DNA methylase
VALPLDAINEASAREKSIRHGHPSTLHLWWARRPLAAARAVIFSSLVDDPSSHPDKFPTVDSQDKERQRLFKIIEELVVWENSNDEEILDKAKAEIIKSTNGDLPELLDPFAGGGAIPLEAQRLGLKAHASDLNPVAVMINKAMIEIPPKFQGLPPVNPEVRAQLGSELEWKGSTGLAEDVRYYGEWMRDEAFKRIGHLYPKVELADGGEATVVAWIWARTVKCPNPACGCEMPLANSFMLSNKKGKEYWVKPKINNGKISYSVTNKGDVPPSPKVSRGAQFLCILCGANARESYIKKEASEGRMSSVLMATVAEGSKGRLYVSPSYDMIEITKNIPKPNHYPSAELPYDPRNIWCKNYGLTHYHSLFTERQLLAMTTLSDLVKETQHKVYVDALIARMEDDSLSLVENGKGAKAYGEALGVYLAFLVDKLSDRNSSICSWNNTNETIRNTFARQSIPMVWDFAEANIFSNSAGSYNSMMNWLVKAVFNLPIIKEGSATQNDATIDIGKRNIVVSTDPPYYDNISYADLSDYLYIWMRRSLKDTYPNLFSTMLVPKVEELIATPYRFDGNKAKAKDFFENGMLKAFEQIYKYTREDIPVTIYYAFKQSETKIDDNSVATTVSSGWETMLSALIQAGFTITGTWPIRTEMGSRAIAIGTNALASSIVLVCRKKQLSAEFITRREFLNTLRRELKPALVQLQHANIAPVDLAQSAIGPGMAVFSRNGKVLDADGTPMSVREALQIINQIVDEFFSEQEGELDPESRFCVELFSQVAFNPMKFGTAQVLATAKNISIDQLAQKGALTSEKGFVQLVCRDDLKEFSINDSNNVWLATQHLTKAFGKFGIEGSSKILTRLSSTVVENAKALAYRLYTIAERKGWANEAYAYNILISSWMTIQQSLLEQGDYREGELQF